ncbi:MAG: hypothetical protein IJJ19_04205 [Erysipelotrichaceae bacterium]|nr:hypothetical protein [Erysipelotrichaceae bacterium]
MKRNVKTLFLLFIIALIIVFACLNTLMSRPKTDYSLHMNSRWNIEIDKQDQVIEYKHSELGFQQDGDRIFVLSGISDQTLNMFRENSEESVMPKKLITSIISNVDSFQKLKNTPNLDDCHLICFKPLEFKTLIVIYDSSSSLYFVLSRII